METAMQIAKIISTLLGAIHLVGITRRYVSTGEQPENIDILLVLLLLL